MPIGSAARLSPAVRKVKGKTAMATLRKAARDKQDM
jgi:hypothetical protein